MRKRAIEMVTASVAVAVLVLGIPGIVLSGMLLWHSAHASVERRAASVASIAESRASLKIDVPESILEHYAYQRGELPARIEVVTDTDSAQAGLITSGATIEEKMMLPSGGEVRVAVSQRAVWLQIAGASALGILAIAFSFFVATAVALRQSRRLQAPLIYLAAAAEQLGEGETRPQMKPSGIEEIDLVYEEIVRSADRMAGRIAAERQFASDASHQLRTPLAALSMRLEEIQYLSDDPDVIAEAGQCLEQVERLAGVVQDLLANSRSASAGGTEAVKLVPIVSQAHEEWARPFAKAQRELVCEGENGLAVFAHPGSLSQILATLIENSLKYGEGTTTVRSKRIGRTVVLEVEDEGAGVPLDMAEAIFRKGVSTGGSTGIGLAIARQLAQKEGSRLELTQASPPIFSLVMPGVPRSLDPEKILPPGSLIAMGSRRRGR